MYSVENENAFTGLASSSRRIPQLSPRRPVRTTVLMSVAAAGEKDLGLSYKIVSLCDIIA